jgi:dTDP-4-dehydrorhamnose reductase
MDFLRGLTFDVLINCAGITSPDVCEAQPQTAQIVNADSPAAIAALCHQRGVRMIQVSTDYVFAGDGDTPLTEADCPAPISVYGETKLAAERAVLAACPAALVTRVSWLFGPDKPSFPETILGQAQAGEDVQAIEDKWSTPTSIDDIAVWLEQLFTSCAGVNGILHLANSGVATWQEYAQATVDIAHELGLLSERVQVQGIRLQGFPLFKARRPRFTPLSPAHFTTVTGIVPDPWPSALERYLRGNNNS